MSDVRVLDAWTIELDPDEYEYRLLVDHNTYFLEWRELKSGTAWMPCEETLVDVNALCRRLAERGLLPGGE